VTGDWRTIYLMLDEEIGDRNRELSHI
jgi:hypothetical protein